MTDETTARDRAMTTTEAEQIIRGLASNVGRGLVEPTDVQRAAIALAAEVRRLRALAGAPTADMAAREVAEMWRSVCTVDEATDGEVRRRWPGLAAGLDRLAAAPEGVDEAECPTPMHHPLTVCRICHPHEWAQRKSAEIANSGRCRCTDDEACAEHEALEDALDGMDLEAQGEMADQLAVAQAAIQRVRDLCRSAKDGGRVGTLRADAILRALDGDTTEEGR